MQPVTVGNFQGLINYEKKGMISKNPGLRSEIEGNFPGFLSKVI
jgi:hypothetical protein